jgi:hypothetical protein
MRILRFCILKHRRNDMPVDYENFALAEESRVLSEYSRNAESQAALGHSGEATVEAFEKASNALIGGFVAAAKGL